MPLGASMHYSHGRRQRTLNIPSRIDALKEWIGPHAVLRAPVSQTLGSAIQCIKHIIAPVSRLDVDRGPSYVTGLIVSVVIDAVQLHFRSRSRPHISKERFKRVLPLGADLNAATTVAVVMGVLGVIAPTPDVQPGGVFGGMPHAVGSVPVAAHLRPAGLALLHPTNLEVVSVAVKKVAANTFAFPDCPRVNCLVVTKRNAALWGLESSQITTTHKSQYTQLENA